MIQRQQRPVTIELRSPDHPVGEVECVVVVPTFRRPDHLRKTLASLAEQKTSRRYAVIVVENEAMRVAAEGMGGLTLGRFTEPEEIAAAIRDHQVVVVCGETGSGKSTQLPKICLEIGRGVAGMIGHTQPRCIAARAVVGAIGNQRAAPQRPEQSHVRPSAGRDRIVRRRLDDVHIQPLPDEAISRCRAEVRNMRVEPGVQRYIVDIVRRTRDHAAAHYGGSYRTYSDWEECGR